MAARQAFRLRLGCRSEADAEDGEPVVEPHEAASMRLDAAGAVVAYVDGKQAALDLRVDLGALCASLLREICKRLGNHAAASTLPGSRPTATPTSTGTGMPGGQSLDASFDHAERGTGQELSRGLGSLARGHAIDPTTDRCSR